MEANLRFLRTAAGTQHKIGRVKSQNHTRLEQFKGLKRILKENQRSRYSDREVRAAESFFQNVLKPCANQ